MTLQDANSRTGSIVDNGSTGSASLVNEIDIGLALGGNSPLSSVGPTSEPTPMLLDDRVGQVETTPEASIDYAVEEVRLEIKKCIAAWSTARIQGDRNAEDEAMGALKRSRMALKDLEDTREALLSSGKRPEPQQERLRLNLSRKDLPRFQLSSDIILPRMPGEEVFESRSERDTVEQFLKTWERIANPMTGNKLHLYWRDLLPLSLPAGDDTWIEEVLKKCPSWEAAKEEFRKHHGSTTSTNRFVQKVYTMTMRPNESIINYSRRFIQTIFNAGIPRDDLRIGERCCIQDTTIRLKLQNDFSTCLAI
ncbi:hypothetical protein BDF20DRAFT_915134 [Mycotypha africana]|uniref:uncharacterized protein n=1 Tax=Mycotypha africana TaxID=64632 RepID=UPI0022FFCCD1|nr:uncharacterized protein BDF20DRAFT_915134 [Mycotypha africana]KAI8973725.1 hypothetical protein BDF20DRAFT_915134 [Mycotypha africana]